MNIAKASVSSAFLLVLLLIVTMFDRSFVLLLITALVAAFYTTTVVIRVRVRNRGTYTLKFAAIAITLVASIVGPLTIGWQLVYLNLFVIAEGEVFVKMSGL